MPYIGSTPTTQNFISGTDYFNGTGAQTAFTLTRTVNSVNDIQVVVNNVVQQPNDAYTLSGTTLTFTSAPSSGTNNVYVRYLSTTLQSITPSYGSIIPSMLNPPNTIYWNTSGDVGIGTTSPTDTAGFSRALDLNGSAGAALYTRTNGSATSWTVFGNYGVDGYINNRGAGSLLFFNNNAERMRILSGGSVGINTSNPTTTLTVDVKSNSYVNGIDISNSNDWGYGSSINFRAIPTSGGSLATVSRIQQFYEGSNQYGLSFSTYNAGLSERMRITSGGFLKASNDGTYYISTGAHELRTNLNNDNIAYLTHNGNSSPYGPYVRFSAAAPNNASNYYFYCDDTSAVRFIVYSNGNVVNRNGSYGTISDIKNKENIVDATPKLDKVMQLKVRNFNLKTDPDLKQIGFVAQEFEQVFPSIVEETADNGSDGKPNGETTKAIKTTVLIPILVKAIQEQQEIIEELKARIETLEAK